MFWYAIFLIFTLLTISQILIPELKKMRDILLAEDDEDDVMFFEMALEAIGETYSLRTAHNGVQLLETLEAGRIPDLLFLDLNMPIKNGYECLKEIKADKELKKCNVVILTTSKNPKHIDACFKLGAACFLVKPRSIQGLQALLKKVLLMQRSFLESITMASFVLEVE
jgi:CheY-like chemotaxis protein